MYKCTFICPSFDVKALFLWTGLMIGCSCINHTQDASSMISSLHFFKNKAKTGKQLQTNLSTKFFWNF